MNAARIRFSLVDVAAAGSAADVRAGINSISCPACVAEQRRGVSGRAQPPEGQVRVSRIGLRGQVPLPVPGMACPRPGEYRLLGIEAEQVAPRLPIPVPQLCLGGHPVQRAPQKLAHHPVPRRIDPGHRVGPAPDDVPDLGVVAVDHPRIGGRELGDNPPETRRYPAAASPAGGTRRRAPAAGPRVSRRLPWQSWSSPIRYCRPRRSAAPGQYCRR
jgi:hypothetical protein